MGDSPIERAASHARAEHNTKRERGNTRSPEWQFRATRWAKVGTNVVERQRWLHIRTDLFGSIHRPLPSVPLSAASTTSKTRRTKRRRGSRTMVGLFQVPCHRTDGQNQKPGFTKAKARSERANERACFRRSGKKGEKRTGRASERARGGGRRIKDGKPQLPPRSTPSHECDRGGVAAVTFPTFFPGQTQQRRGIKEMRL